MVGLEKGVVSMAPAAVNTVASCDLIVQKSAQPHTQLALFYFKTLKSHGPGS